jgi:PAS domain S-box-containing protein
MRLSSSNHRRACRMAALVSAMYAALGCAWILLSDTALLAMSSDPAWQATAQRSKGLAFVAVTAVALLWLVYRGAKRLLLVVQLGARSALREQDLFEGHPQPMWYYDPRSLAFLRVNNAAERLYGYSQDEFLQMTVPALRHPDERVALAQRLRQRAPGFSALDQARHCSKSGRWFHVRISAQDARYDGRAAVLVLAVDIDDQVAAQQALQRQEQQFRVLHQSLAEVLWLLSADGQEVLYASPAFEQVYGFTVAEFHRDPSRWLAQVHPADHAVALQSVQQLMAAGNVECEYRICRPDGSLRWLSDRKKLVRDAQGQVTMIAGIAEDITARRLDQDTLRRNTEELAERYAELERFNRAAVGREIDMIALKREVNALALARALPAPYRVDFAATAHAPVGVP